MAPESLTFPLESDQSLQNRTSVKPVVRKGRRGDEKPSGLVMASFPLYLTSLSTQCYSCVMIPEFEADGNLPPGVHWATWDELCNRLGTTPWRRRLLVGLRAGLENLRSAGCSTAYVDGSFVTSKPDPADFDACWDETGVDLQQLDPVLLTFAGERAAQKAKYAGEFFPSSVEAGQGQGAFLEFFQTDKDTGAQKGIVALDLGGLT